jgi:hypothetical protein
VEESQRMGLSLELGLRIVVLASPTEESKNVIDMSDRVMWSPGFSTCIR